MADPSAVQCTCQFRSDNFKNTTFTLRGDTAVELVDDDERARASDSDIATGLFIYL